MTLQEILAGLLGPFGVLVGALVILWGGWQGIWVWGRYHTSMLTAQKKQCSDMEAELRDQIKKLETRLTQATRLIDQGNSVAKRAVVRAEEGVNEGP